MASLTAARSPARLAWWVWTAPCFMVILACAPLWGGSREQAQADCPRARPRLSEQART
jgi:hypothetical protein